MRLRKIVLVAVVLLSIALLSAALLYGAYRPVAPAETGAGAAVSADSAPADSEASPADDPRSFERIPAYSRLDGLVVARVAAGVGDDVREGQVLAELDDAPLLSDLRRLQEAVRLAEKDLRESAAADGEEREGRRRLLDEARRDLADVQMKIGYRYVLAPASGVVLERSATPGARDVPGVPLFVIGRPLSARSPDLSPASGDGRP